MKLTCVAHSGFLVEGDDFVLVIDYYKESADKAVGRLLERSTKKWYVLASHAHPDHFNPEVLSWEKNGREIQFVFSSDIRELVPSRSPHILFLDPGDCWQDDTVRIKAYGSTDLGVSFLIDAGGKRLFHAGDLNNWHWKEESAPEEVRASEAAYLKELEIIAADVAEVDVAMFPLDPRLGAEYTLGAVQFLDRIRTHLFAPMHFWERYPKIHAFKPAVEQRGVRYADWTHTGETMEF
ncbi:MAG: MBL fold metallo-hydrolase [Culturomica sp.]|jgi:L-ascorbate metabolism protein UlaG (beta-lactamase superfamily)|nr:MBL fold metallo-hydrolase [Culturomica sp.]